MLVIQLIDKTFAKACLRSHISNIYMCVCVLELSNHKNLLISEIMQLSNYNVLGTTIWPLVKICNDPMTTC